MTMTIFISAVTAEFKKERIQLTQKLRESGHRVTVQEDLDTSREVGLLARLHDAIDNSDIVVAILGTSSGMEDTLAEGIDSFSHVMEALNFKNASYTQWEVYFALAYGKALVPVGLSEIFKGVADFEEQSQRQLVEQIRDREKWFESGPEKSIVDVALTAIQFEIDNLVHRTSQQEFKKSHRAIALHAESLRSLAVSWLQASADAHVEEKNIEGWFASRRATFTDRPGKPLDLPWGIYGDVGKHVNHIGSLPQLLFLGGPGSGKTTLIYQLAFHFTNLSRIERYKIVPVFANCLTLAPLMQSDKPAHEAVEAWLQIAISPLFRTLRSDQIDQNNSPAKKVRDFEKEVKEAEYTLLILIDGLDELDPSGNNRGALTTKLLTALSNWAMGANLSYVFIATTRPDPDTQHAATTLHLQTAKLEAPSEQEIERIATKLLRLNAENAVDPELLKDFVKEFKGNEIKSALVYLQPLARYYREYPAEALGGAATRLRLMEIETAAIVRSIREDLEQARYGKFDAAIRDVLLEIALLSLHNHERELPASVARGSLAKMPSIKAVPGLEEMMNPKDRLVHRLLHVMIYDHRVADRENTDFFYRLPHNEYRDYLLADGIFRLVTGNPPLPKKFTRRQQLACSYLGAERVEDFMKDIIKDRSGEDHESRRKFALFLVELMNDHKALKPASPIERTAASPHGAMMTLLLSLGQFPDFLPVQGKGVNFQRTACPIEFRGRLPLSDDCTGASFRESNLQTANFSGLTLDQADFDNADLKGANLTRSSLQNANLRNVAMGASGAQPTLLTDANLEKADFFNYRFQLSGFYHFWDLELGGDEAAPERYVLVAASRGQILAFDLTQEDKLEPVTIQTAPRPNGSDEIMDMSRHPRRPEVIVITGRDSSVRILKLLSGPTADWPKADGSDCVELEEIGRCEDIFHTKDAKPYSRRAQFSSSGDWLAVAARDERVAFFRVLEQGDHFELQHRPTFGREHTGPVMCLVAPLSEQSNGERPSDLFYTAGYDGRVAVWREERGREPECWLRAKWISDPTKVDHGATVEIFRSLIPGAEKKLWAGTELSGWLRLYKFSEQRHGWHVEQAEVQQFPEGIFALAVHGDLLAVGLAGGTVKVFRASPGKDDYEWNKPVLDKGTSQEIVRSLRFIQGGRHLLAATWDGCLFRFDLESGKVVARYEYPRDSWLPQKDVSQIQFDGNPFSNAEGISPRMRQYLGQVQVEVQKARSNG